MLTEDKIIRIGVYVKNSEYKILHSMLVKNDLTVSKWVRELIASYVRQDKLK